VAEKKLGIVFTSDTSAARKGISDLNSALGSTEAKAKSSGAGLKTALGGLAIGAFVLDGVRALGEIDRINAQTSAALKSTGAEAWITADAIEGMAGAIEKKTGIEAEAIQSGQNLLLTFTNVQNAAGEGNDIFDQATQTMADMSTAMGTDATTSAMQLGKALNDPIKGISALSKVGVTFTADQKAMVAEMVAAGDTMGAQKVILAELNKEFGGSAEAFGETLPGQIAKAKNALGEMQESILAGAVPALEMGAGAVGTLASAYAGLPAPVQTVTTLAVVGAATWVKFGDSISAFGGHAVGAAKKGADLARTLSQGLDGVAATRGITKTQAATEMLKSSMDGALGPTGRFSQKISGLSTAAVGGGAAFVAFGSILYAWQDEQAKASRRAAELEAAIKGIAEESMRTGQTVEDVFTSSTLPNFIGENAKAFEGSKVNIAELNEALIAGGQEWRSYAQAQIAAAGGMDTAKGRELVAAFQKLEGILPGARTATEQQGKANEELGLTIDPLTGKTVALGEAMSGATESFAGMGDAVRGIGEKFGEIPGAADAARTAISNFYDEITGNLSAQIEAEAALDSLAASFAANGASMDINSEQGRTNASALIAVKDAAAGAAVEILNQGGTSAEAAAVMQGYVTRLNETQAAAGFSEAEIAYMNATMGLTPTDIKTVIESNAKAVTGDVDTLNRKITTLPNGHVIVTADTSRAHSALDGLAARISALGATLSANLSRIAFSASGRAKGGPVEKGELYLVGEEGPELAMFGQSGQIIDAAATRALLGQKGAGGKTAGGLGGDFTTIGAGGMRFGAMGGGTPGKPGSGFPGDKGPRGPGSDNRGPSGNKQWADLGDLEGVQQGPPTAGPADPPAASKPSAFDLTDVGQILERQLKAQGKLQKSTDDGIKAIVAGQRATTDQLAILNGQVAIGRGGSASAQMRAMMSGASGGARFASAAASGAQVVINVHGSVITERQLVDVVADGMNRAARNQSRPLLAAGVVG
jgi:hypothetical protein